MANIILRLSTGSTSSSTSNGPNNSLGGKMGTDDAAKILTTNTEFNNLWDDISKLENSNNTTDYRCIFVHNDTTTPNNSFLLGKLYFSGSPKAVFQAGIGAGGVKNSDDIVIANETTAPTGVTFADHNDEASALALPTLEPNDYIAIWLKRTANNIPGSGVINDLISINISGVE